MRGSGGRFFWQSDFVDMKWMPILRYWRKVFIMRMFSLCGVYLLLLGACQEQMSNSDCTLAANPCAAGFVCDAATRTCISPNCTGASCTKCKASTECLDSAKPVCELPSGSCRPCAADSECDSGLCRKAGDYPVTPPISGLMSGQCIPTSQVVHVNSGSTSCSDSAGTPGTGAQPFCQLSAALVSAKPYYKLAGSTVTYNGVTSTSGNFVIVGPGRDASPPARIDSSSINSGSVVFSGVQLRIKGGIGGGTTAITCKGSSSNLYVVDSVVSGTQGIDASQDCGQLTVNRSRIQGLRGGLLIGGKGTVVTNYAITNSTVTNSGNSMFLGETCGTKISAKASGLFLYNTLTANYEGLCCDGTQSVSDSIVAGNTFQVSGCITSRVVESAVDLATGIEPKLLDTPNNAACCIDKGLNPSGGAMVPTDYFGTARPRGNGYDIGFHELK